MSPFKKIILVIVIIGLVVPVSFAVQKPRQADAFIQCFLGKFLNQIQAIGNFMAIPVREQTVASNTGKIAGDTTSLNTKECLLDFLVTVVAKAFIQSFTRSIVNWINSGFEGSPAFVTNPEGFFADITDRVAGATIEQIAPWLCAPIAPFVLFSLSLRYSSSYYGKYQTGCTLSYVEKNINHFLNGTFNAGGQGWANWLAVTTVPQNNVYGAEIAAAIQIDRRLLKALDIREKDLSYGKGFMSFKRCKKVGTLGTNPDQETAGETSSMREGEPNIMCDTVTPGSLIQEQLTFQIGSQTRQLEVADEINEIIGALVNQMMLQIFSATGLAGSSRSTYKGGSYTDRLVTNYKDALAIARLQPTDVGLNDDDCKYTYRVWDDPDGVFVERWTFDPITQTERFASTTIAQDQKNAGKDAPTLQRDIEAACANAGIDGNVVQGVQGGDTPPPTPGQGNQSGGEGHQINIALGGAGNDMAIASQLSTLNGYGPQFGNDGSTFGGGNDIAFGLAATQLEHSQWWQVDFSKTKFSRYIETIVITPASEFNRGGSDAGSWVFLNGALVTVYNYNEVTKEDDLVFSTTLPNFTGASPHRIPLCEIDSRSGQPFNCVKATKVLITRTGGVALAEVSVFSHPQPIIFSTGGQTMTVDLDKEFYELDGVTAKDFYDKPVTVITYTISGPNGAISDINDDTPEGVYTITYIATDSAGVPSQPLERIITVGSISSVVPDEPAEPGGPGGAPN